MNEFALGGGISECGDTIATTAEEAGLYPWLGITTPYTGVAKGERLQASWPRRARGTLCRT